jgi:hypothetical protein
MRTRRISICIVFLFIGLVLYNCNTKIRDQDQNRLNFYKPSEEVLEISNKYLDTKNDSCRIHCLYLTELNEDTCKFMMFSIKSHGPFTALGSHISTFTLMNDTIAFGIWNGKSSVTPPSEYHLKKDFFCGRRVYITTVCGEIVAFNEYD